jgi:alcohol dehydrogenase class IV
MHFEFATAGRIVFGSGAVGELPGVAHSFGDRVLVVTGGHPDRHVREFEALRLAGQAVAVFATHGEPTVALVREGVARLREISASVVVAIGGGSAVDAGKAIAAMATNPGDVLDYLEVVGRGAPLVSAPLPCVAVPTTAGTGAEVTRNAVLGVPEAHVKVSLRSALMLPRVALVDPDLTRDVPAPVRAASGLDALTQLIEAYVSIRATRFTDALCLDGLRAGGGALLALSRAPDDAGARAKMSYASLLSGMALANAGLGVVHGLAAPLGGMFGAPHGALCAALLAPAMRANIAALDAADAEHPVLARYSQVAAVLTGRSEARPEAAVAYVRALVDDLGVPGLARYGVRDVDAPEIAARALKANSMKANPIALDAETIARIVVESL